jgi:hypothetical protein
MRSSRAIIALLVLVLGSLGCYVYWNNVYLYWNDVYQNMAGTKIDITLKNASSNDAEKCEIFFGNFFVFGPERFVGKGHSATYSNYLNVNGSTAEVEWTSKATRNKKIVDFKNVLPEKKSGQLTFTILDDRVEVNFKPENP